ncbi:MAG: alpha-galactosidase [Chloroflexi bacterium]|nr:alpha-galactosidase [Chloroflexota bacterium]
MTASSLANSQLPRRESIGGRPAWLLRLRSTDVLLCLGANDALLLPYWGRSGGTDRPTDYVLHPQGNRPSHREFLDGQPVAYPVYGDALFKEVCLVVARPDGSRDTRLSFVEDRVENVDGHPVLDLVFQDELVGLRVTHRFQVFVEHDIVVRSATIENRGSELLVLERALTAALPLPPDRYDACTLHGTWGREFTLKRRPLAPGKLVVESRRGSSSHEAHPWFAIRPREDESEHTGAVWFGSLAWSGNWICSLEVELNDAVHIVAGVQPFDFAWRLTPGESFTTPELAGGYSDEGLGGASRLLQAFEEEVWLPASHRDRPRPILYNSWEATNFAVRADQQIELARRAAAMGTELFVVDDGWFGARDDDFAALGDWTVNAAKFPNGLRQLIDEVHGLGMQFGIWVEPEMVNPNSDLYRAHPDWAYHIDGREPTYGRNQLVLNFARDDVREHLTEQLRRLLSDHGSIEFVKWDHNRAWTEVGWPERPEQQREVWVRHVRGVYAVLATLRREFPEVLWETCAGGGGRADLGMLRWTDQAWTSDNTDAADRLTIQYGFSRAHTPRAMVNWVTDVPNQQTGRIAPLAFRFHVAMQGVLGIGGDINEWSAEEIDEARRLIAQYKQLRPLVQFGRQYWLVPPTPLGPCAVQYVSPAVDRTVVFVYQMRGLRGAGVGRLHLHGLQPGRKYRRDADGVESTGAALMAAGIPAEAVDPRHPTPMLDWYSGFQVWTAI